MMARVEHPFENIVLVVLNFRNIVGWTLQNQCETKLCQIWVCSFHLKTEQTAVIKIIKFHQHIFIKKRMLNLKNVFVMSYDLWSYNFPRTQIWNQVKIL